MKSLFVDKYIVDFYWYFILLIIITINRQTLSAAVLPQNSISLYTENDKVTVLTSKNFSSTVYQSKTAWLIEFYASWCGHCQSYANTYREVAIDTWGWRTVVRIGAINCHTDENSALCEQHNISAYPTLRLIEPEALMNTSKTITVLATDAKDVERELIKELADLKRTDKTWPHFASLNQASFEDLYNRISSSVKMVLVIIEKRDDFTGRQIMLDFSKYYEQLAIFRMTTDRKLWYKFQINMTDIPALFAIFPNRTVEQINTKQNTNEKIGSRNLLNYAIRSRIRQTQFIDNFDDTDLEEIIQSRNALENMKKKKKSNQNNKEINNVLNKNINDQKISMVDLETSLSYMLRREIPRVQEIRGETYDALVHWLIVLTKYFPGREPVMNYLKQLLSKVQEQPNGLTGKQFRELADTNTPDSYLPKSLLQYKYCVGSSSQYRGYPCSLWILFHTLTVSQVQLETTQMNTIEIPSAIKYFIKNFFSCRHCSENFMKETQDINQLDSQNKHAAVMYLWTIHNRVNKRLHGDNTEDPLHPKIQFPSGSLCSKCHLTNENSDNNFDLSNIINFLLRYYSKDNIDLLSVENFIINHDNKQNLMPQYERRTSIDQYSMIEITDESTEKFGLIRFIISIIQHFPLYFFILLVIIIIFVRRRYFKSKRKRYTL
ncbi:unnamed protein product [Rotaria sordida]|uniref:Sulfhydryl oxidase n=1 Tax=Rotaria sordida TaxID=392033 RepID=A0A814FXP8_9BILA|nr:unnamed protein product [Rotaria sordida]CAF1074659.1 unnamed protein product [Rotaria sordida]CAF1075594.1 unnamed protein product [Rotaria sordida]